MAKGEHRCRHWEPGQTSCELHNLHCRAPDCFVATPQQEPEGEDTELHPSCYLRPADRARLKCGEAATVYPVSGITGRPGDATIPLYHPYEVDRLRARIQPRRDEGEPVFVQRALPITPEEEDDRG